MLWHKARVNRAALIAVAAILVSARLGVYALVVGGDPAIPLCRWDCDWYVSIAARGYAATSNLQHHHLQQAWPFFPLLPILLAVVHRAGLLLPDAACLVACLCTIGIAAIGHRYRASTRLVARASTWLALTVAMPFGLYFTTGYSEALYALLALATLLGLARSEPASLSCALLTATRPTGILLAPAVAIAGLRRSPPRAALATCLISISGLLAWSIYCAARTGDPLAFVHAQAEWRRHLTDPLAVLLTGLRDALRPGGGLGYDPLWALVGLAIAAERAWRRRWAEAFLLAATVLLALSSGSATSMPRFVGASPVFLLFLADRLDAMAETARRLCLAASFVVQLVLLHFWLQGWHGLT